MRFSDTPCVAPLSAATAELADGVVVGRGADRCVRLLRRCREVDGGAGVFNRVTGRAALLRWAVVVAADAAAPTRRAGFTARVKRQRRSIAV
jgi:hypothetical protein